MNVDSTRLESDRASAGRTHAHDHATDPGATSEATASTADRRDHDRHAAREHHGEPGDGRRAHRLEHRVRPRAVGGRHAGERHDRRDHEEQQRPVGVGRGPDRREQRDGGRRGEPRQPQRRRGGDDARHVRRQAHAGARAVEPRDARASGARPPVPGPGSPVIDAFDHQRGSPAAKRLHGPARRPASRQAEAAQRRVAVGRERHDEGDSDDRRPVRDGVADRHPRGVDGGRPAEHERDARPASRRSRRPARPLRPGPSAPGRPPAS